MSDWHRRLIAETRALQGLSPTIADDPVGIELAARFLAAASTPSSHASAGVVEGGASGAAGTHADDEPARVGGETRRAPVAAPSTL